MIGDRPSELPNRDSDGRVEPRQKNAVSRDAIHKYFRMLLRAQVVFSDNSRASISPSISGLKCKVIIYQVLCQIIIDSGKIS